MAGLFDKFHSRINESSAKWIDVNMLDFDDKKNIVPLSVADMEFETAEAIKKGLSNFVDSNILGYTLPWESYYKSIVDHYKRNFSVEITRDNITSSTGVVTAIYDQLEAFSSEGDGVIIFSPVYHQFYKAIENTSRKLVDCPLLDKKDHYDIDFESFEKLASDKDNKILILCSPHNPSGRIWTQEELERVLTISRTHNLTIFSDEIHADLGLFGEKVTSMLSLLEEDDQAVVMSSASKTYNLAGLQCSYSIFLNKEMKKAYELTTLKRGFHGPNVLGLKATELAFNHCDDWVLGAKKTIENNFHLTKEFFKDEKLFRVFDTRATYLAWISFEGFCKRYSLDYKDFNKLLKSAYFFVSEGQAFGENGSYFMRINLALPTAKYKEALARLEKALEDFI